MVKKGAVKVSLNSAFLVHFTNVLQSAFFSALSVFLGFHAKFHKVVLLLQNYT